ncbi:MAG: hypothetical protein ACE5GV_00290 [Candidatus Scalindua sp.]
MRSKESGGEGKKRAIAVFHRRGGKDLTCWNILIEKAIEKKGVYYYIFPNYAQARKAFWDNITEDGRSYLDFIPPLLFDKKWLNEMKVRLVNGSMIQIVGSENYDTIRGTNPSGVVLSEYAYQNPQVWVAILSPILQKNNGWAIFNSTPQGKNHFYELYEYAKTDPEWYAGRFTIEDTGLIDAKQVLISRKQGVSEEMIQQEYFCSFSAGVIGSYYGKQIDIMEKEGRIGYVPCDANRLVYTAWDLGFTDSMAIIFFQKRGNEILIIDHYENSGYALSHYLDVLRERGYNYAKHFAPHDAKSHSNTGTTFVQIAREAGFDFTVLDNKFSIMEGIEIVRGLMPRMFIDATKCEYLIKCLLQYHSEWNEKAKVFRNRPKHDYSSHSADCLRYVCLAQEFVGNTPGGMTKEKLQRMRRKHGY